MTIRTLTAAGLAAALLAGCGTASHLAAKPQTCRQQYEAWTRSPATRALVASLRTVTRAMTAQDIPRSITALKGSARAANAALGHGPPRCADPHGYWDRITVLVRSAGDDASVSHGMQAILLASQPLGGIPPLESRLHAELRRTLGAGY